MLVSSYTKFILANRRDHRDMTAAGFHKICIHRSLNRPLMTLDQQITEVAISADGRGLWVKIGERKWLIQK